MPLAPIVLFVYNRPHHTAQTLAALAANGLASESDLYIYADGPKTHSTDESKANIAGVRELISSQKWCRTVTIVESDVNNGLANSIIKGVTETVKRHGKAIVLEDDLVTHPFFLTYMNHYLDAYENEDGVISVHGFMYPIKKKNAEPFFLKGADCWGWATWKRGWDLFNANGAQLLEEISAKDLCREFNFNNSYNYTSLLQAQIAGEVDSWAIRWYASAFLANKLTLYPPVSLVCNIGFDGSGTHLDDIGESPSSNFNFEKFGLPRVEPTENKAAKRQIELFFRGKNFYLRQIKQKLRSLYSKL